MVKATEAQGRPQSTQGCQCLLMPKTIDFIFGMAIYGKVCFIKFTFVSFPHQSNTSSNFYELRSYFPGNIDPVFRR